MNRKTIMVAALIIWLGFSISPVLADDICKESINTICIGCHNTDRVCQSLGASEKTWKDLLEWMVSNGAEIEGGDMADMVKCFSEPSIGVKAACGK